MAKAMICGVEGPCVFWGEGRVENRVRMDDTKTRKSGGKTLCGCRTAPLKPRPGLNGPPVLEKSAGSLDIGTCLFLGCVACFFPALDSQGCERFVYVP
jgi:hypothetical protein